MILSGIFEMLNEIIQRLINGIWELLQDFAYWLMQFIIDIFTLFLSGINIITFDSFPNINADIPNQIVNAISWLVPTGFVITCLSFIAGSTVIYFTGGTLLRWAKVIR